MPDDPQKTAPQIGRIDLGPTEPRHLTQTEQRVMDAALRRGVTILPDPEVERLKVEVETLRRDCLRYESYILDLEDRIRKAHAALGWVGGAINGN